jgi:DNA-binding NtrC family response regulator
MFNHEGAETAARARNFRLLAVDDDPVQQQLLVAIFRKTPTIEVVTASDGESALSRVSHQAPDIVLLDLCMPGLGGLEILQKLKAVVPRVPVVVITGTSDIRTAVEAIQLGAYQFLTKPVNTQELVVIVKRALERTELLAELESLRHRAEGEDALTTRFGSSPPMKLVTRQIRQVAASHFTVLVQGQTGVGKEVVARAIHDLSPRAEGPFVAIDCGAIPESLLESELFGYEKGAFSGADRRKDGLLQVAHAGTLLLDEVGNLPTGTQAKLLRVLQERSYRRVGDEQEIKCDVRIVAATNRDLQAAVSAGDMREDFYYRIRVFLIQLPPLRERREDIPLLVSHLVDELSAQTGRKVRGVGTEAMRAMLSYGWPGNVRELRNALEHAFVTVQGDHLRDTDLPAELLGAAPGPTRQPESERGSLSAEGMLERRRLEDALRRSGNSRTEAAKLLGISRVTLWKRMQKYGIGAR